jgi:hypothetical protein
MCCIDEHRWDGWIRSEQREMIRVLGSNGGRKMLFLFSLMPATALVVLGYFVLFSSTRAEATTKRFGQFLATWLFFLAGVVLLASLIAPSMGLRGPMGGMMGGMEQHMQRMEQMQEEQLGILRDLQGN